MNNQIWTVAITPSQRLILLNLSHGEGQKLKGQRGRSFRRFVCAFGIDAISTAAALHPKSAISTKMAVSLKPSLFTLTAENVDYALDLLEVERTPGVEMVIGPLFDTLEDLKAGRDVGTSVGASAYDPSTENWAAAVEHGTPEIAERIAAYLRAAGQNLAAELVDRGDWDRQEELTAQPNSETQPIV